MGKLWAIVQAHIDSSPYPPSERQVAAKLGISPTALSKWRAPKRLPDVENLRALARLAGVPYSTVLDAALQDTGYQEVARDDEAPMTQAPGAEAPGADLSYAPPAPEGDATDYALAAYEITAPDGLTEYQRITARQDGDAEESQDPGDWEPA